jgi:hypothetical protein
VWVGAAISVEVSLVGKVLLFGYWANALALVPYARLQAIGKPDLVAKALMLEIPVYWVALYFALQSFGLLGAASVFAARLLVDYVLLSLIGRKLQGLKATLGCAVLLTVAMASSELRLEPLAKGSIGTGLLFVSLGLSLWLAPRVLKEKVEALRQRFLLRALN